MSHKITSYKMWNENILLLENSSCDDIESTDEVPCVSFEENEVCTVVGGLEMSNDDHGKPTDIQIILLENSTRRAELCVEGPELPEGKRTHLFVSYSNYDNDKVLQIVAVLEREFGLRCIVAERDFQSGRDVLVNITSGMEGSAKILLFVSPNFLRSKYCQFEEGLAFVLSLENAKNIIIPVKLEECEVPLNLRTLTYIDATKDIQNVPKRIMKAFNDQDDYLPLNFAQEKQKLKNGFFIDLTYKKGVTKCPYVSRGRPHPRIFEVDQNFIKTIRESKIKATEDVLQTAVDMVNEHNRSHYCSMVEYFWFPCCSCICTSVVLSIGILFALFIYLQSIDIRGPSEKAADVVKYAIYGIEIIVLISAVLSCILSGFIACCRNKAARTLDNKLFDTITALTYTDGFLCSILCEDNRIKYIGLIENVRFIRYNVKPCEEYLARKMKEHPKNLTQDGFHDNPQKKAQEMTMNYLRDFLKTDKGGDVNKLLDAPENRHNVKGGKMCFCQILEQKLPPTEPFDEEAV